MCLRLAGAADDVGISLLRRTLIFCIESDFAIFEAV
jgi:hypothetical protein